MVAAAVAPGGGWVDVALLKDEGNAAGLMMEDGISTLTFYKGDAGAASAALRQQFGLVVAANPWLAGHLERAGKGVVLRHPASPSEQQVGALFRGKAHLHGFQPSPTAPYLETCAAMFKAKEAVVPSGNDLLGKGAPVSRLTVAGAGAGAFSVVFSLSHAVGDGRTYYEVLKMLQPGAEPRALRTERKQSFSEDMRDVCGRKELEWADTCGTQCLYTCGMMFAPGKPKCFAFELDEEQLAAAKSAGKAGGRVAHVSTNDVITSGFFTACKARIGMMGMDCRGRMEGIEDDMAGNYVTALTMDESTFGSPAAVREMLSSKPFKTTTMPLPSCFGWMCGNDSASFAMATNWSSFAGDIVQLEGCELQIHLPLKNPAYCVFDLVIPFAARPGKVGLLCWVVSTDERGLRKALPLGSSVDATLFPAK